MPLDRHNGEVLDGLPASLHIVIEPRHLANMTNYITEYEPKTAKFRRRNARKPTRSVFDDAVAHAVEAFKAKGALFPVRFDETSVLVQVYPKERTTAVVFQRDIAGETHYVTRIYPAPQPVIESLLTAAGKKMPHTH